MNKKRFYVYSSWREQMELLNEEEKSTMLMNLFRYQEGEEVILNTPMLKMCWASMKFLLEKDDAEYQARVERGRKAGKSNIQHNTAPYNTIQSNTAPYDTIRSNRDNVNDNVNDNDNVDGNGDDKGNETGENKVNTLDIRPGTSSFNELDKESKNQILDKLLEW